MPHLTEQRQSYAAPGQLSFRGLAAILVVSTTLWYVAGVLMLQQGKLGLAGLSNLWTVIYLSSPILTFFLAPLLVRDYLNGTRSHALLFWFALVFSVSPFLFFLLLFISSFFQ